MNYRLSHDFQTTLGALGATHILTRPHSPWQNDKAERFNRTLLFDEPVRARAVI